MAKKEVKNKKDKTSFMKNFRAELKKVIWPTPKQLINNTIAVLSIVIFTAAIVFVLDFAFKSMNKYGIDKIKNIVANISVNDVVEADGNTVEENNSEEVVENTSEEVTENNQEETVDGNTEESNVQQ